MLQTILNTKDFSEWEAEMASSVGSHHTQLLDKGTNFTARIKHGRTGDLDLLHLQGSGRLELERTQPGRALLWVPLQGRIEERVNGELFDASPGRPLLFRPGDQMLGRTGEWIEGISVLLPADAMVNAEAHHGCGFDPTSGRRLTMQTLQLARALEHGHFSPAVAAEALLISLEQQFSNQPTAAMRGRRSQRRRWELAMEATRWMQEHLHRPFSIDELAAALNTSKRTIQAACLSSLGRPPLAQAKLLRLRALRRSLQDASNNGLSVAELMQQQGLPASGSTAASYRHCFGETPSHTRQKANP
jgi:AraC-like DNA-binding protein